jgi:hypothetical protein
MISDGGSRWLLFDVRGFGKEAHGDICAARMKRTHDVVLSLRH